MRYIDFGCCYQDLVVSLGATRTPPLQGHQYVPVFTQAFFVTVQELRSSAVSFGLIVGPYTYSLLLNFDC